MIPDEFDISELHTTRLGEMRIMRNLHLDRFDIDYIKGIITHVDAVFNRKGKNWYIMLDNICLTVNAYTFTIITAHFV